MISKKSKVVLGAVLFSLCLACKTSQKISTTFNPSPGSNIVFIGNTFAERLQHYNYFEPLLYKSFPDRHLTVRNMGWSADEVNLQLRPLNFGSLDDHLKARQADVIFACFGLNEAFKGPDSLLAYKEQLKGFLQHLQQQSYNGKGAPQVILVSPIAHENLGGFLPNPSNHNRNLEIYVRGMAEVAAQLNIPFVDIFDTSKQFMDGKEKMTINGIHLNDQGYKTVSELMATAINLPVKKWENTPDFNRLKQIVDQKNKHFFYKFRAVNSEYIVGRRKEPWVQPAGGTISYPTEFKKLDRMILRLDSVVWAESQSENVANLSRVHQIVSDTIQFDASKKELQKPDPSQFVLPEGYEINLFASEIDFDLANPVKITFDPKGRLWVASMPSYPHYLPGAPPNDKILILEDTNGDGRADKQTVFADSLYMPLGFELGKGGAYVTQAPDLIFLKDTDGDGKADDKEILVHGFGTEDVHHSISAQTWGPDGGLYWHMGTFLHTQTETPYGPQRDAYGSTWRYEPRTGKLKPYVSYPYANPWGQVFMQDGTHLIADVSTGMNYFAPPLTVSAQFPKKHVEMKDFLTADTKPKTCGMEIISSSQFPDEVQGDVLFNTFIGFQGIKQHRISEEGSGITAKEVEPLLQSKDPNFRPVDLQFGPDGALYVVDWYNPIISHGEQALRDPRRDHTHGRIWRISYKNKKTLPVLDLSKLKIDALLNQLKAYEDRTRYRTRMQIREFEDAEILPALDKWLGKLDENDQNFDQYRLEALWLYQELNHPNEKLLQELLASKNFHIRAAATRVLFYWNDYLDKVQDKLIVMSKDEAQRVRLEAVAALSHFPNRAAVEALLAVSAMPADYYIKYALKESFKELKPVWMEIFKNDQDYLASEPEKAAYLLQPLSSEKEVAIPGFITDDPQWRNYARSPLSAQEYQELKDAKAVTHFLETLKAPVIQTKPAEITEPGRTVIHLKTLAAKMLFDQELLKVKAGTEIALVFENVDGMPHNLLILQPGSNEKVGKAAEAMAGMKDGYEKHFVPDIPEVLFSTPLVNAGKTFTLNFKAPSKPGDYPFICSFPGHWQMMKGILRVE